LFWCHLLKMFLVIFLNIVLPLSLPFFWASLIKY